MLLRILLAAFLTVVAAGAQASQAYSPAELIALAEQFPAAPSPKREEEAAAKVDLFQLAYLETRLGIAGPRITLARLVPSITVNSGGSCDSLCALFGTLAQGQWKEVTNTTACAGDPSNFNCTVLGVVDGNWCADYDGSSNPGICGSGSIWSNAGDVEAAAFGGIVNALTFSIPGIRKADGEIVIRGGGHSVSPLDGTVSVFNAETAAYGCLHSGCSGGWYVLIPGPRYLPYATGKPSWSNQPDYSGAGCPNYWWTTNYLGQEMQGSPHSYSGIVAEQSLIAPFTPGTGWVLGGTNYGCPGYPSINANAGAGLIIDDTSKVPTLLVTTGDPGSGFGGDIYPGAYDDLDGLYYTQDANYNFVSTNLSTGALTVISNCVTNASPVEVSNQLIFPDPSAPTTQRDFLTFGTAYGGGTVLYEHLNSGSITPACQNNTYPAYIGVAFAYNDDNGHIIQWDGGGNLYDMPLNFTTPASSISTEYPTTPTGDIPSCPNQPAQLGQNIQYIPAGRPNSGGRAGILVTTCGEVWARAAPF